MSAFKKLQLGDSITSGYTAKKRWIVSGSDSQELNIQATEGINYTDPPYFGITDYDKVLNYRSLQHLYYSNFVTQSVNITGSFENYLQSSLNTRDRSLQESVGVISFPKSIVGEYIEPGSVSFTITDLLYVEEDYVEESPDVYVSNIEFGAVTDDGEGKIISNESNFLGKDKGDAVGDVVYNHGNLIFTEPTFAQYFTSLSGLQLEFTSNYTIFTKTFNLQVSNSEFNFSQNPSTHISQSLNSNITGSEFAPYITSIGLYNDVNDLIAVAKLSRPIPKSKDTDMTFVINLDM